MDDAATLIHHPMIDDTPPTSTAPLALEATTEAREAGIESTVAPAEVIAERGDELCHHAPGGATAASADGSLSPSPTAEQVIEALLFASDSPLSAARLAELAGFELTAGRVEALLEALNERYAAIGATFRVQHIARGYQLLTLPEFAPWLTKLDKQRHQSRLTGATMEVLAVVAYKQPVIRADIEAIRGVACGDVLNRLREMGLVKIVGRAEIVGRPLLYGTTRKFLDVFGLADLDELPPMEALSLRRASAALDESRSLRAAAGA
ncbi:MAG: SMC-Scp complex subunit ScpB [Phycisphaerales bacterium]|nr:SMC-Scp complex subunit ScpB [Phycisphaerales bacterium]